MPEQNLSVPAEQPIDDRLTGSLLDLTAILSHLGDGVIVQDLMGQMIYANEAAAATLGFSNPAELLAASTTEVIGRFTIFDEDGEVLLPERFPGRRALAGQIEPPVTIRVHFNATGAERWSVLRALPIFDTAGSLQYAVNVWHDVTEQKRAEHRDRSLAAIVETADDAIIGKTTQGVVTSWNPGAARLYGYTAEEMIGQSLLKIFPPDRQDELEQILATIRAGERINHYETVRVAKNGRQIDVSISISPLVDDVGRVIGAATIARNVSARKREEASQRFLAEVGELLATSLDVETTLETVAMLVVPWLGDWCAVHLERAGGQIELVTLAHVDPTKVIWARELQERFPIEVDAPTGVAKVIRTGRPDFWPTVTDAMIEAAVTDPQRKSLARALEISAVLTVPLTARGRTVGAISLYRAGSGLPYDQADLNLAMELARRAALSIDNARLFEETRIAEARFRAIYAGVSESILLINEQGQIIDANDAAIRLLGFTLEELRAMSHGAESLLVDRAQAAELPALREQGVWHREIVVRRKDGKTVPIETHVAAVDLAEGRVFLALWHNIAERKAAERFEHEFLAELAHDLKNPLASARLQAQRLGRWAKGGRLDEAAIAGAAASVEADTSRIAQRIDELAEMARTRLSQGVTKAPPHA